MIESNLHCRVCGAVLGYSFLREYPGATICSSRKCYYKDLARTSIESAALVAQLPKRYRKASLDDFEHQGISALREALLADKSVFLTGTQGIGKTHLAGALINSLLEKYAVDKGYDVLWRRNTDLLLELQETFGGVGDTRGVINRFKRAGLLVIDDFGAERISDWSVSAIYSILAERIDEMRPTIVTSNLNLDEIDEFEPRIASRLAEFATLVLPPFDRRLLV